MKKNILMFSALALFAISGIQAQESSKRITKATTPTVKEAVVQTPKTQGPGMLFESETIDYGTIAHKSNGNREFVFINNGTEPLIIKSASGSCGCTVPTWPKEPIAPGQKAVIGVGYDTNRTGAFTKTVTITTNIDDNKKVLTIKGNVLNDASGANTKS